MKPLYIRIFAQNITCSQYQMHICIHHSVREREREITCIHHSVRQRQTHRHRQTDRQTDWERGGWGGGCGWGGGGELYGLKH